MSLNNTTESLAAVAVQKAMAEQSRHNEIKAQNERIINGQMITQQLLRDIIEGQKKANQLLNQILAAN